MTPFLIAALVILAVAQVPVHMALNRLIVQRRADAARIAALERQVKTLSNLPLRVVLLEEMREREQA